MLLTMQLTLGHIGSRSSSGDEFNSSTSIYLQRASSFVPCDAVGFRSEEALFAWVSKRQAKTPVVVVLLDCAGQQMTSEGFASWLRARRDAAARHILFAIGPADGWTAASRQRAQLLLSLGPMTLAHSVARLVVAEQLYRACTILAGHPYHTGH
jgi:23S rRNA (pseudouridine1915-N3)-methyltransferase